MSQTIMRSPLELQPLGDPGTRQSRLKTLLLLVDLAALTAGWFGVLGLAPRVTGSAAPVGGRLAWALGAAAATLMLMGMQNLYLDRVCSVRTTELQGLGRSVLGATLVLLLAEQIVRTQLPLRELWIAAATTMALLATGRTAYAMWLRQQRVRGRYISDLILVGADGDAVELAAVVREHPEFGFRVSGYVGATGYEELLGAPRLGEIADAATTIERMGATDVVVIASALGPAGLNEVVRDLLDRNIRVRLSSGVRGIAQHRFRATPLAYEPLFFIEPVSLMPWQLLCKRSIDVVGAIVGLVAAAPILAVSAIAIRLDTAGPILFRQKRVGRDGIQFVLFKLRTMVSDAESQRRHLEAQNQRMHGPLFKLADDPRTTRVGRFLRTTSIDELPQLWNVLKGSMSLVGPRPALPSEVKQFDEQLRQRTTVTPGLTGLWQVEARDNPSFAAYRRLDLYYIENWSPLLDLGILMTTAIQVIGRLIHRTQRRGDNGEPVEIVLD